MKGSNDSLKAMNKQTLINWGASEKAYQDSLNFERGQRLLIESQKQRTEDDLNKAYAENKSLLDKYESGKYADTTMVYAPAEFIGDCHDCFGRLKYSNNLTLKYQREVSEWGEKYKRETAVMQNRYNTVERERDSYFKKVDSFTNAQGKSIAKIKPTGRLYLSWGVLWSPWPVAAGGGLMYQTTRNVIYGVKGYYGVTGDKKNTMIETTINFPLSLKIK